MPKYNTNISKLPSVKLNIKTQAKNKQSTNYTSDTVCQVLYGLIYAKIMYTRQATFARLKSTKNECLCLREHHMHSTVFFL